MAQFASDNFSGTSGTELSTYNSSWIEHGGYSSGNIVISDAGRAYKDTLNTSLYYHSGTPASADYTVSADLFAKTANGNGTATGVCGRVNTSATTFYTARYEGSSGGWQLYKFVAGSATQLGSTVSSSFTDETSRNIKLEMIGSAIKVYVDGSGTATISITDSSPITAAGKAGIRMVNGFNPDSNTAGLHIDNFSADDVGVSYTLYSPTMVYSAGGWYPQVGETVA